MKKSLPAIDLWIVFPAVLLVVLGLLTLLSVNVSYFRAQLLFFIVSLVAFFFVSQVNLERVRVFALPMYIFSLILLLIVLIIGFEARGAIRWIELFGVNFQPSEACKPLLTISMASFLAANQGRSFRSFIFFLLLIAPVALSIILQPDLGTALIYIFVAFISLLVFGYPLYLFITGFIGAALLSPFLWVRLHEYQRQRIMTFIHPTSDPLGTSYNVIQAIIAVGSGQFLGRGLSQGTQSTLRFLPERHTDFIFATLSEGLGFIGSILVVAAFIFLFYRIYRIYQKVDNTYEQILIVGAFGFLLIQFFVNIGMNIGILPVVGVTLPFLSYGGSSLLSNFIFLGMLSSLSVSNRNKYVLEIR